MTEVVPLAVTPTAPGDFFVGEAPWVTTRDDEASYIDTRGIKGGSEVRLDFPDIGASVPLAFVVRSRAVNPGPEASAWINVFKEADWSDAGSFGWVPTATWEDHAAVLFDGVHTASPAEGGPFSLYMQLAGLHSLGAADEYRLTYIALTVGATRIPPRRIFPRDDALTGGAPRNYPPSKGVQSGIRTTGGYL